jgi:hypothetical protein
MTTDRKGGSSGTSSSLVNGVVNAVTQQLVTQQQNHGHYRPPLQHAASYPAGAHHAMPHGYAPPQPYGHPQYAPQPHVFPPAAPYGYAQQQPPMMAGYPAAAQQGHPAAPMPPQTTQGYPPQPSTSTSQTTPVVAMKPVLDGRFITPANGAPLDLVAAERHGFSGDDFQITDYYGRLWFR